MNSELARVFAPRPGLRPLLEQAVGVGGRALRLTAIILIVVVAMVCCWRYLDLYERNTQAAAVHARIAMERHEAWKAAVAAQRAAMTPAEIQATARQQLQQVPALGPTSGGADTPP